MSADIDLNRIAANHGARIERRLFDGGETIYVTRDGKTIVTATSQWGDKPAAEMALEHLRKYLDLDDLVEDAVADVTLDTVLAAQDGDDAALQALIDAGSWSFEGSMGRAMMACIEDGRCVLGPKPAHDYWGNRIPSRDEVKPGTKGSVEYAAERQANR